MIEHADVDRLIVRECQKRRARSDAGTQDSDAVKALLPQPVRGRARVEYCLPDRLNCAAYVRADQMFGSLQFTRLAFFVIRKRETQGSHSQTIKDSACLHMTVRLRVPLRQHNYSRSRFSFSFTTRRKKSRAGDIVFRRWSFDGTGPG